MPSQSLLVSYSGQIEPIPANIGQSGQGFSNGQLFPLVLLSKQIIMAQQAGNLRLIGTIDGLTFYKMYGKYYVRTKSSLDKKRILRDPSFEQFRQCSKIFGKASKLAKELYHLFPKENRKHGVFGRLTGEFNLLFREGKTAEEAILLMLKKYLKIEVVKEKKEEIIVANKINQPSLSKSFINEQGIMLVKNQLTIHKESPIPIRLSPYLNIEHFFLALKKSLNQESRSNLNR
jgi:hypothetical protein